METEVTTGTLRGIFFFLLSERLNLHAVQENTFPVYFRLQINSECYKCGLEQNPVLKV